MKEGAWSSIQGFCLSLMRLVLGLTFGMHGTQKLLGYPSGKVAQLASLLGVAGSLELLGGALLFFGLFTRPVAFVLSGQMAVAYFHAHAHRAFWPIANGGELAVVYCFVFLYLFTAGAGPVSLDRILRKK
jgi:putative oxidoreductase